MKCGALALSLASLCLGVFAQDSCITSTPDGYACGSYPNGCPGSGLLSPAGNCKSQFGLVDGSKCCCGCPKEDNPDYRHCVVEVISPKTENINYKTTKANKLGFCQDQKHFIARDPTDLFTFDQCKQAQEEIAKRINAIYKHKGSNYAMPIPNILKKFGKNNQGDTYWIFRVAEMFEKADVRKKTTESCPKLPFGDGKYRAGQCVLEKHNPCLGSLGGLFHVSTDVGYGPKNGVEYDPAWKHG
ncbi:hypothetical protein BDV25DRAFT_146784 [Aspergillus avenaceus]|uniref:Uncharacterized protein n=1 Tax=Aspergillus avenaceus TaxID=36643 RepID=A0A5N6U8R6_ASPAV|nr:hypothetical protein BDV25DRAFT_146784 [Aspergillus avenaceus]